MSQKSIRNGNENYCLWGISDRELKVGLIGTGPGFRTILDIITNTDYLDYLPLMTLVGVAETGGNQSKLGYVRDQGIPIHETTEQLVKANPDIDILIELTGNRVRMKNIRDFLPDHVSFIDHNAAIFLCGIHNMLMVSTFRKMDLDRHKALLQAIIDEVKEDILLLDLEGRVVDMNKNVVARTGKAKDELRGLPCYRVQTLGLGIKEDESLPFCESMPGDCPFRETLIHERKAEGMFTRVSPDGLLLYYRVYSYPIFNLYGTMTHILMMRRDITMRTRREKHQQQAEKLAVMGEMSMYLAHEIRNPLFAIGGFSNSLLASKNLDPKEREKVRIIAEETSRLDNMLTSILNFSKPSKTVAGTLDINAVCSETVELMRIGYAKSGTGIRLTCRKDLPQVVGEPEMVKQCLVNLLKNSLEAMEGHKGEILVATNRKGGDVYIEVADTGKGMSEGELEKVFSPFYTTKDKGCGLGLAMIKKIVEESGGQVTIKSREGRGTTVTLHFAPVLAESHQGSILPGESVSKAADEERKEQSKEEPAGEKSDDAGEPRN